MWDDSNVDMNYQPTLSHVQRITYSSYYGGNCAKGGIFLQFCGFLGGFDLFSGGVSDSEYFTWDEDKDGTPTNHVVMGILRRQQIYQEMDLVNGEVKPFFNMLDKGFRVVQKTLERNQKIIQPIFTSSERNFYRNESLCISEVASDQSGNKRAVRCIKCAGYITKGLETHQNFERINKV